MKALLGKWKLIWMFGKTVILCNLPRYPVSHFAKSIGKSRREREEYILRMTGSIWYCSANPLIVTSTYHGAAAETLSADTHGQTAAILDCGTFCYCRVPHPSIHKCECYGSRARSAMCGGHYIHMSKKSRRIDCVILRCNLQITQPIIQLLWHICSYIYTYIMYYAATPPSRRGIPSREHKINHVTYVCSHKAPSVSKLKIDRLLHGKSDSTSSNKWYVKDKGYSTTQCSDNHT